MICVPCRYGEHHGCPELARQADDTLPACVLAGSSRCDCQHGG